MQLLILDGNAARRAALARLLAERGHAVREEEELEGLLAGARTLAHDAVLCSVELGGLDGRDVPRRLRAAGATVPVLVLAEAGTEDIAVALLREGAYAWLRAPVRADELDATLAKAEERERLRREVEGLRTTLREENARQLVVAESRPMRSLLAVAARVARHDMPVLVSGEGGVGKKTLARAIHRMSERAERPLLAVNCTAFAERLLDAELFGVAHGALPAVPAEREGLLESARGGTVLIEEVSELPPALQEKLVGVLDHGLVRRVGEERGRAVDVRVLCTSTADLRERAREGRFDAALLDRLSLAHLAIPPLRERREDVGALVAHFARHLGERQGRPVTVSSEALTVLAEQPWSGNVRELRTAVERAALLGNGERLVVRDLVPASAATLGASPLGPDCLDLKTQVLAVEREAIRRALETARGNRREAARLLGVSLRTLFYKMRQARVH